MKNEKINVIETKKYKLNEEDTNITEFEGKVEKSNFFVSWEDAKKILRRYD